MQLQDILLRCRPVASPLSNENEFSSLSSVVLSLASLSFLLSFVHFSLLNDSFPSLARGSHSKPSFEPLVQSLRALEARSLTLVTLLICLSQSLGIHDYHSILNIHTLTCRWAHMDGPLISSYYYILTFSLCWCLVFVPFAVASVAYHRLTWYQGKILVGESEYNSLMELVLPSPGHRPTCDGTLE